MHCIIKCYRLRRRFENLKIVKETARFAETLKNLNKFSKLIRPVKSPSSMTIEMPMVSCDLLTDMIPSHGSLPIQTTTSAVLEDLSEYFDVTALLSHNLPLQETPNTINNVNPYPDI